MSVYSDEHLESMGLRQRRPTIDEIISFSHWTRKADLHTAIRAQNVPGRPSVANMWRFAQGTPLTNVTRCNMGICVINISAVVTGGMENGNDKNLPVESFLCKKEMGVWTKKYLTSSEGSHKHNAHLKQASDLSNYSISKYNEFVPTLVWNAISIYKDLYLAKYLTANTTLTHGMISQHFTSFKCDYEMEEEGIIDEHVRSVHNISGIEAMTPIQRIEVDTKVSFEIPDLLDLEVSGPDKRATKIDSLYTRCVARHVVTKTNNKSTSDLIACRSQEFLTELGKKCTITFFNRFKMYLSQEVDADIDADFTCKWSIVESSLYKAMSTEQNTLRLANFYDCDYKQFHSLPMELLINRVDTSVDSTLGKSTTVIVDSKDRTLCNYLYSIKWKYMLIFNIARHLNADFKIIKDYIMKEITKMHDDTKLLVDIGDFQKKLCTAFDTKGVISQFKNENIPAPQKSMAVNETKVKPDKKKEIFTEETPELIRKVNSDYKKIKIKHTDDEAIKAAVDTLALKLAEDPANANKKVTDHADIAKLLKEKKKRICWSCRLANCLTKQMCSNKLKMKKQYVGVCKGKPITFKELKDASPSTPTATAQVTSPASIESDSEDIIQAMNRVNTYSESEEFGFNEYTLNENIATCTINRVVNLDTFPKFKVYKETEFVKDKSCLICFKSDLNLEELTLHMGRKHDLSFYEDDIIEDEIDDWIFSAKKWDDAGLVYESDKEESEPYDGSEDQADSDYIRSLHQFSSNEKKSSDSSSDSSPDKHSNGKKKKHSKCNRSLEKFSNKTDATLNQIEAKIIETEKNLKKYNDSMTTMLENQEELKSLFKINQSELKNTQSDMKKMSSTMIAQNNSNQKVINTIQDGIVANTLQISSNSAMAKQYNVEIEKRIVMLNEQKEDINIPPSQPEPAVQTLEANDSNNVILEENADLSSVLKTPSKDSPPLDDSQSNNFITPTSPVSIEPEPAKHFAGEKFTAKRIKISRVRKHKLRRRNKLRVMERNEEVEDKETAEETVHNDDSSSTLRFLVKHTFSFLITIITGFFNVMNTLFTSPYGFVWGVLALLAYQFAVSHASPVLEFNTNQQTSLDIIQGSMGQSQSLIFYSTERLEASSFITHLNEIHQEEVFGIKAACDAIKAQQKICLAHPASCQYNQMSISNYEETIEIRSQSLFLLKQVCETSSYIPSENIITKCHGDLDWNPRESKKNFKNLSPHFEKFTNIFLQDSANSVNRAKSSKNMIENLLSHSEVLDLSNPNNDKYRTVVRQIVTKEYNNLTNFELEEMTRLSTENTKIISMAMPISGLELRCENTLIVKTTITPITNPKSRKEMELVDGKLIEKYGDHSTYTLLSQDSAISMKTSSLEQGINLVSRSCIIHNTINATSTKSNDTLIEILSFQFKGNLTIEIICPRNGSLSSDTWILTSGNHKLKLPLVCSLHSERINCDSVTLRSKVITEEESEFNSTSFVRNNILAIQTYQLVNTPIIICSIMPLGISNPG